MTIIAAVADPPKSRASIVCLILLMHFVAGLVCLLVFCWRRKKAFLLGTSTCSAYRRDTQPIGYWFTIGFYSLLTASSLVMICYLIATLARGGSARPQLSNHRRPPTSATASGA